MRGFLRQLHVPAATVLLDRATARIRWRFRHPRRIGKARARPRSSAGSRPDIGMCGRFQSAPLNEARGDPSASRSTNPPMEKFQSAPLNEARGDLGAGAVGGDRASFNPLPSTKRGEMRHTARRAASRYVSIRSPQRSEGRLPPSTLSCLRASFNPLPSTKRGEIFPGPCPRRPARSFNPLPSTKRGEISPCCCRRPNRAAILVSIRSPQRSEGRFTRALQSRVLRRGFNPLPSTKRGEILIANGPCGGIDVSIRSPQRSEGRSQDSSH